VDVTRLRVAACQLNPTVGDLDGNVAGILAALEEAEAKGADLAIFGELAVCGYMPEDLLLKPGFVEACHDALGKIAARTGRCVAVVGFPEAGRDLSNAAAVLAEGRVQAVYRKRVLPNNTVFDEQRYFVADDREPMLFSIGDVKIGVSICEDAWSPTGPIAAQAAAGAQLVININGSPFHRAKVETRERIMGTRAADASCALVYVNQVGGQDELVYDGGSMLFDETGRLIARAPQFVEQVMVADLEIGPVWRKRLLDPRGRPTPPLLPIVPVVDAPAQHEQHLDPGIAPDLTDEEEVYCALVLGTRDYARKNGFTDVVLGLSGGIDSSLVTVIAADALGADRVHAVALPSRYSTEHSISDAEALCTNLGVDLRTMAIEGGHGALLEALRPMLPDGWEAGDLTDQNLQGRIRAALLMGLANTYRGWLVLICGNKSELAVGYTTVYGVDMAGGFAPIKDVPKTLVYRLAAWRNAQGPSGPQSAVIPEHVLTKPPSAELAPGQLDSDNLPPYDVLDPILERYVEWDWTRGDLEAAGYDPALVQRVTRMVDIAEWKRRQAPVGVRVSPKAFGKDRRLPITNGFRG
jgi:NAD+ synthase (glutamine-hydrolysing)